MCRFKQLAFQPVDLGEPVALSANIVVAVDAEVAGLLAIADPIMFTVDVEGDWGGKETRAVREVLPPFLDLLERYSARATFSFSLATLEAEPFRPTS